METILIIIIILLLGYILINNFTEKPLVSYKNEYYEIDIKDLPNPPKWMEPYESLCITKSTKTIHTKWKKETHKYSISFYSDSDDDYDESI